MKRAFLILAIAALALPAAAFGKGPSEAVISGPGGGGGDITFTGCCAPETPTMSLAEQAGFFPAVFARQPDPMVDNRPKGELGPKYTIKYTVPGPNNETWKITQDVYPYATPGPMTYMKPGQTVFQIPGGTRGGWFQAGPKLKETLVAAGLPSRASSGSSDRSLSLSTTLVGLMAIALFLVAASTIVLRRRERPAPAA